jgi:hypothetical protein
MIRQLRSLFGGNQPPPSDPKDIFAAEVEQFLRSAAGVKRVTRVPGDFAFELVTSAGSRRCRRGHLPRLREGVVEEDPAPAFVRRPFLPHVDIVVAMDRPTSMTFVSRARSSARRSWNERSSRAPPLAFRSSLAPASSPTTRPTVLSGSSRRTTRTSSPASSCRVGSRPSVARSRETPSRSSPSARPSWWGGDGRPEMTERLLDKAEREFAASNRRVSPAIYTADDAGKIVPYARPAGDPLAMKVTIAQEKLAIYEHGQQREALDKLYEKSGPDVFVASYQVFQARGGDPRSLSVWTKGVRSYLPRTERVMLLVTGDEKGAKPKATVEGPVRGDRGAPHRLARSSPGEVRDHRRVPERPRTPRAREPHGGPTAVGSASSLCAHFLRTSAGDRGEGHFRGAPF